MRVFLLGPGYYQDSVSRDALHDRLRLAELLSPHHVSVMELADSDAPDLPSKFAALCGQCDEILVWLPLEGRLATVFGELLLMRYEEAWHGKGVTIVASEGVLDVHGEEFRVRTEVGQIAYLLDLASKYAVQIFEYADWAGLERLVQNYASGALRQG